LLQLLGLREYDKKLSHAFFGQKWTAPGIPQLLQDPDKYIEQIPEDERWNMYFTAHHCAGKSARDWSHQDIIPFDIDDIDVEKAEITAKLICEVIGLDYQKTGVVMSGHGLQMHVLLETPIKDSGFFKEQKELYKLIVQKVNETLEDSNTKGKCDPSVFSGARLLRLPNTINRKPHKGPDVMAVVLQSHMEPQGFKLELACGAPELGKGDTIHQDAYAKMPAPDTDTILKECDFLVWAGSKQKEVSEPQWYAALSIWGRLKNGAKLAHEFSKDHHDYSSKQTDFKLEQALKTAGPRTCTNINQAWGKCNGCKHWGSITSPISIQGDEYISTETTGFYHVFQTLRGEKTIAAYEDLVKYYRKKVGQFVSNEGSVPFVYSKDVNTWSQTSEAELKSFAYNTMEPRPRSNITQEFHNTISKSKIVRAAKMNESCKRKLNLKNGVFNLETMSIEEKKPEHYFMSHLPYEYDPEAQSPIFDKFMHDITCGDEDMQKLLLEYMGYAISGDDYWIHKALILYGEGSNGKSTFNKLLKGLVGSESYSSLNIEALQNDQKRAMIEGKLFNLGDENSSSGFLDSAVFKALSAGEEVDIKQVYCRPYSIRNRAKLIFNCNSMPVIKDKSEGMLRRLLFVPFNAVFDENDSKTDKHIDKKLIQELPGILNKCIAGYTRLVEQQNFTKCATSETMTAEYRHEIKDVDSWFEGFMLPTEIEEFVIINEAYASYTKYCEINGNKWPQNRIEFGRILTRLTAKNGMKRNQKKMDGINTYVISGAKLRTGY